MKKAFTMIELIFVIVIIGILASVAIPKLAATRDDAQVASIIGNARTALGAFQTFYTANGQNIWNTETVNTATNVPLNTACDTPINTTTTLSPNTFVLCHADVICLSFETINGGNLTINDGSATTDTICEAVKTDPAIIAMSNKTYVLGGSDVLR